MSFIADLLSLINWNVRRRTHSHGGDDSSASESANDREEDSDHPELGLEFIADRADEYDDERQP